MEPKYKTDYQRDENKDYIRETSTLPFDNGYSQYVFDVLERRGTKPVMRQKRVYDTDADGNLTYKNGRYIPCPYDEPVYEKMTDDEILAADMTNRKVGDHATQRARDHQARLFFKHGYEGPLPQGSGRALAVFVRENPEYASCLRRGWTYVHVQQQYWERWVLKGPCYVFKSPLPGLTSRDFLRLCKMLKKSSRRLADQIKHLMENPEALEEAKGLLVMDNLAEGFGV